MKIYPAPAEVSWQESKEYDPYEAIKEVIHMLKWNPEFKNSFSDLYEKLVKISRNQNSTYSQGIPYTDIQSEEPGVSNKTKRVPAKDFRPNRITIDFEEKKNIAGLEMTNMKVIAERQDGGTTSTSVGVTKCSGYLHTNYVLSGAIKSILRCLAEKESTNGKGNPPKSVQEKRRLRGESLEE